MREYLDGETYCVCLCVLCFLFLHLIPDKKCIIIVLLRENCKTFQNRQIFVGVCVCVCVGWILFLWTLIPRTKLGRFILLYLRIPMSCTVIMFYCKIHVHITRLFFLLFVPSDYVTDKKHLKHLSSPFSFSFTCK